MSKFQQITPAVLEQNQSLRDYLVVSAFQDARKGGTFVANYDRASDELRPFAIVLEKGGLIVPDMKPAELEAIVAPLRERRRQQAERERRRLQEEAQRKRDKLQAKLAAWAAEVERLMPAISDRLLAELGDPRATNLEAALYEHTCEVASGCLWVDRLPHGCNYWGKCSLLRYPSLDLQSGFDNLRPWMLPEKSGSRIVACARRIAELEIIFYYDDDYPSPYEIQQREGHVLFNGKTFMLDDTGLRELEAEIETVGSASNARKDEIRAQVEAGQRMTSSSGYIKNDRYPYGHSYTSYQFNGRSVWDRERTFIERVIGEVERRERHIRNQRAIDGLTIRIVITNWWSRTKSSNDFDETGNARQVLAQAVARARTLGRPRRCFKFAVYRADAGASTGHPPFHASVYSRWNTTYPDGHAVAEALSKFDLESLLR